MRRKGDKMMKQINFNDLPVINHTQGIEMWVKNETKNSKWKKLWVIALTKNGKAITKFQNSDVVTMYDKAEFIKTQIVPIDLNNIPAWCFGNRISGKGRCFIDQCITLKKILSDSQALLNVERNGDYSVTTEYLALNEAFIEYYGKRFELYQKIPVNPDFD